MKQQRCEISFFERFSYAIGDVGCNFVWTTIASFLTLYYTDSVGIAAGVAGTIMLITRFLDGITDLIMGVIIDHTNTRWGKARPWVLWSTPMMVVGLIVLFSVPSGFSMQGKIIYAFVTYVFVAAVAYTASNLSYNTLLSLMTEDQQSRISANSLRFICTGVVIITISYATPTLTEVFGWTGMAVVYGALATICFLLTFFFVKERVVVNSETDKNEKERMGLKEFKLLFQNRYFITIALIFIVYYLCHTLFTSVGVYFARDVLGDEGLYGTLTLLTRVPMMIGLVVVPSLVNRFGKWKCMMVGFATMIVGLLIIWFGGSNTTLVMIGIIIRGVGTGPIMSGIFSLVADGVDYGEWKSGVRQAGLTNSATSFGMKVGTGFGSALVGWGLEIGGYNGAAAVQTASTLFAERVMYAGLPVIGIIICMICLYFTNIDKIYGTIRKDLDARRQSRP